MKLIWKNHRLRSRYPFERYTRYPFERYERYPFSDIFTFSNAYINNLSIFSILSLFLFVLLYVLIIEYIKNSFWVKCLFFMERTDFIKTKDDIICNIMTLYSYLKGELGNEYRAAFWPGLLWHSARRHLYDYERTISEVLHGFYER